MSLLKGYNLNNQGNSDASLINITEALWHFPHIKNMWLCLGLLTQIIFLFFVLTERRGYTLVLAVSTLWQKWLTGSPQTKYWQDKLMQMSAETCKWSRLFVRGLNHVRFDRLASIWIPRILVANMTWGHRGMMTSSNGNIYALLAICAGNSPVPGEFPTQRPVTRIFNVYFDLRPNKRLSKQSWGWWFETQSHPLWRHRNDIETLSTLLAPRAVHPSVTGGFASQGGSNDDRFCPRWFQSENLLNKQSIYQRYETSQRSRDITVMFPWEVGQFTSVLNNADHILETKFSNAFS